MIPTLPETRPADHPPRNLACNTQGPDAASPSLVSPLAALLDPAFLNRGETVLLARKPSLWFIPLSAGPALSIVAVALAVALHIARTMAYRRFAIELAVVGAGLRVTWSILVWMGRLYLLTDLRILQLGGVFTIDVVSCPLRKVANVRLLPTVGERLTAVGSIEITPRDSSHPAIYWQTVAKPAAVQQEILAAVTRASQTGSAS
jgi:hypothetical protein